MSIHEAALYGDLVKYLRDVCAKELAELKGVDVETEQKRLDEVIRTWFFTPQKSLYGYTPRRIIRNEELGIPNTIPEDRLPDALGEDYPFDKEMREMMEAAGEEVSPWQFGLAPDITLLDEYDPEGGEERWRIEDERLAKQIAKMKQEAQLFPPTGADDPGIAEELNQSRRILDDDSPF